MRLSWTEPESDGGSPITGYVVEKQDRFSTHWTPVTKREVPDTSFTVSGLSEGMEYEFRVVAQNKAGPGKYSEATRPTVAKPPYSKCQMSMIWESKCTLFQFSFSKHFHNINFGFLPIYTDVC